MKKDSRAASDKCVVHDSGWVTDGHHICWNGSHGAFMGHPDHCPFYVENKIRVYLCSPGCFAANQGIALSDLPDEDERECRQFSHGSEPIRWRIQEMIHPDLTIEEQVNLTRFMITLDCDEEVAD